MKFGLKAIKKFDGTLCVVEWYEFRVPAREDRGAMLTSDIVDDGIRTTHKTEYSEFRAFVDAHDSELYERAKAAYPEPILDIIPNETKISEESEAAEPEAVPTAPKSRKQKRGEIE